MENTAAEVEKLFISTYTQPRMVKVVDVHATPAVQPGENFLSTIWRLSVTILKEDGDIEERNFVLKKIIMNQTKKLIAVQTSSFSREILMYENFIKKMDAMMSEFGDTSDRPWCHLISHQNCDNILLQDLKPLGYSTANKINRLTLEEAKLVFQTLGKFHAAAKAAEDKGYLDLSLLPPRKSTYDPKVIEAWMVRAFQFASLAIQESWGPQWKELGAKMNQPSEVIQNKILEAFKVDPSRLNAVLHGDLWTNNILFQRDDSGTPTAVKFVDLQLSYYNSVACDIMYLAYTSLSHNLRKQHFDLLLKIYTEALQENLRRYHYPIEKIPTYEYILQEMKRIRFLGLAFILLYGAIILAGSMGNEEDAKILMDPSIVPKDTLEIYKSQFFRDAVSEDLAELIEDEITE